MYFKDASSFGKLSMNTVSSASSSFSTSSSTFVSKALSAAAFFLFVRCHHEGPCSGRCRYSTPVVPAAVGIMVVVRCSGRGCMWPAVSGASTGAVIRDQYSTGAVTRDHGGRDQSTWTTFFFCRRREALLCVCARHTATGSARDVLAREWALPDHLPQLLGCVCPP